MARNTARNWKGKGGIEQTEELELPSGNVCLVRRVGPEVFLSQGLLPDSLTAEVERAVHGKKGLPPSTLKKMATDPNQIADMMLMMDRILCFAVVDPKVKMPPSCVKKLMQMTKDSSHEIVCGEYANHARHTDRENIAFHEYEPGSRDPDILYADEVVLDDKVFIMNFVVGGTRDFDKFRQEREGIMASISTGEDVEGKAE